MAGTGVPASAGMNGFDMVDVRVVYIATAIFSLPTRHSSSVALQNIAGLHEIDGDILMDGAFSSHLGGALCRVALPRWRFVPRGASWAALSGPPYVALSAQKAPHRGQRRRQRRRQRVRDGLGCAIRRDERLCGCDRCGEWRLELRGSVPVASKQPGFISKNKKSFRSVSLSTDDILTEMGRFIWITQRNHSSLQIQAARLAHIRSTLDLSPGRGYYLSLPNRWSR